jgi:hypothetical protein
MASVINGGLVMMVEEHTQGLKPPLILRSMRPKPKGLGYLIVAGLEEEQRQERETAGSSLRSE